MFLKGAFFGESFRQGVETAGWSPREMRNVLRFWRVPEDALAFHPR